MRPSTRHGVYLVSLALVLLSIGLIYFGPSSAPTDAEHVLPLPLRGGEDRLHKHEQPVLGAQVATLAVGSESRGSPAVEVVPMEQLGDPELGFYKDREELFADIVHVSLLFLDDDWIAQQAMWKVGSKYQSDVPFLRAFGSKGLSESEKLSISEAADELSQQLYFLAEETWILLEHYSDVYARSLAPIPHGQPTVLTPEQVEVAQRSRYVCSSRVRSGLWDYPVEFMSANYPDLETRLDEIAKLRHDRQVLVRSMLEALKHV